MLKRITIIALLIAFLCVEASAQNRTHRRRGVLLGGLAGAAIGAAIGDKGDNETAGALIGGAVGAVAGGTIGNQKDQRIEHNQRYHSGHGHYSQPYNHSQHGPYPSYRQPHYTHQVPVYPQPAVGVVPTQAAVQPIAPQDVVAMVRSGLSEPMIIQQIRINGVLHPLSVGEVIQLYQLGVSEPIISAMQGSAPIATNPQVIVEPTQSYEITPPPGQSYGPSIVSPSNGQ